MKKTMLFWLLSMAVVFSGCSVNVNFGDSGDDGGFEDLTGEEVVEDAEELDEEENEDTEDEAEVAEEEEVEEKEEVKEVKEVFIERGEDVAVDDISIIKKYYRHIEDGELSDAYDMRYKPKQSLKVFNGWYATTYDTKVYDIEELSDHKYQFTVELDEDGGVEETYRVVTVLRDGLLDNTSAVKTWDNYSAEAYTKTVNHVTSLYVKVDGTEKFVREFDADLDVFVEVLRDYSITPDEKYLVYELQGWEWTELYVFDIKAGKEVHSAWGSVGDYGFTKDKTKFYQCGGSGMHAGQVGIYSVPSFDLALDLNGDDTVFGCYGYNSSSNSYKYSLSFDGFMSEAIRTYHFDTGIVD